jgi:hypothetical protein
LDSPTMTQTHLPLPVYPSAAHKLILSIDILEEIIFLACLNPQSLGPPDSIYPLSLTCKQFAAVLSTSANPAFFNRLFQTSFGMSPQSYLTPGRDVKEAVQNFWTFLKKFRNVYQGNLSLKCLGVEDWNFVASFISVAGSQEHQAFRQLTLYAHVDKVSRDLLLGALPRPSGRKEPVTWLAMGIWWATHLQGSFKLCKSNRAADLKFLLHSRIVSRTNGRPAPDESFRRPCILHRRHRASYITASPTHPIKNHASSN